MLVDSDFHIKHPILLVLKMGETDLNKWRLCADLQAMNKALVIPNHVMKDVNAILRSVKAKYYVCLDLLNGYYHLPIELES